jgi:hypothetical protein
LSYAQTEIFSGSDARWKETAESESTIDLRALPTDPGAIKKSERGERCLA